MPAEGPVISGESVAAVAAVADESAPQGAALAVATPVLAITDIIRSAAEQASATWKAPALPAQRRESPAAPFRPVDAQSALIPAQMPAIPALAPVEPAVAALPVSETPAVVTPAVAASPAPATPVAEPGLGTGAGSDTGPVAAPGVGADAGSGSAAAAAAEGEDGHWPRARRQIALLTAVVCTLILVVLLGHSHLPNVLGLGSLTDTFLPWTVVPLLSALPAALLSLKKWAIGVCLLACGVWAGDFAPTLLRTGGTGPADIRVLSQNVSSGDAGAPDLSGVARLAERRGADIVVLQGLSKDVDQADQAAPARYGYRVAMYEFVVWSRFPIGSIQPVDLAGRPAGQGQSGAVAVDNSSGSFGGLLRFTVNVNPNRQVTVYAVHLPQPSLSHDGFGVARGDALEQLVDDVQAEKSPHLVVVGDLDVAQTDRAMRPLLTSSTGLVSAQAKAGSGFGFTWPAKFPVVRLDDVLSRGLSPVASVVLPAVGPPQAHRPIEADLRF